MKKQIFTLEKDGFIGAYSGGPEESRKAVILMLGETGKDSNGNYYQTGNIITNDGRHFEFRISTVTVEEMYGLNLPVEGMFVGLRLTQIILKD